MHGNRAAKAQDVSRTVFFMGLAIIDALVMLKLIDAIA
jgi:hypothetical protein